MESKAQQSQKSNRRTCWKEVFQKIKYPSCLLIGMRRSGKSFLIKQMLIEDSLLSDYDIIIVFTNSFNREHYINCGVEEDNIQHDATAERIQDILDFQEESKKKNLEMLNVCVVLDDCFGSRKEKTGRMSDAITKIYSLGRHMKIAVIVALQDIRYSSHLLNNTDLAFFFPNGIRKKSQREFIKNELISNFTEDQKKIDECFKNDKHQFTVCHLTSESDEFEDCIMKGKVPLKIVNFKIKKEFKDIVYDRL